MLALIVPPQCEVGLEINTRGAACLPVCLLACLPACLLSLSLLLRRVRQQLAASTSQWQLRWPLVLARCVCSTVASGNLHESRAKRAKSNTQQLPLGQPERSFLQKMSSQQQKFFARARPPPTPREQQPAKQSGNRAFSLSLARGFFSARSAL